MRLSAVSRSVIRLSTVSPSGHATAAAASCCSSQACQLTWPHCSEHLRASLPPSHTIELVVASPLRRALQTALYAFSWLVQAGVPLVARAEWQEITDFPCDTGSDVDKLKKEFPTVDFSALDGVFPSKTGHYLYAEEVTKQRGKDALDWLSQRPEKVIAVVSHGSFLRTSVVSCRFANADYRVYDMKDDKTLVEWDVSRSQGGAMGRSPKGSAGVKPGDFKSAQ